MFYRVYLQEEERKSLEKKIIKYKGRINLKDGNATTCLASPVKYYRYKTL